MKKQQSDLNRISRRFEKEEMKLLKAIARGALDVQCHASDDTLKRLLKRGAIQRNDGAFAITSEGKQTLRRFKLAAEEENVFTAQHQDRVDYDRGESKAAHSNERASPAESKTRINRAESPLVALAMRKRPDGSPWVSASQLAAGERLRADFERSQMHQSMGMNWDRLGETGGEISRKARGNSKAGDLTDSAVAARGRYYAALDELGDELSRAVVDFCCYQRGLEAVEREHLWPARSAKQIMRMALARLARHYGFSDKATGPARNRTRHWGDENYRPSFPQR